VQEQSHQYGEFAMDTLLDFITNNPIILGGAALGGFIGLLVSWREIGKILRMMRTSTGEIASLPADEQVEIVGKAESDKILNSPITKTPCVFWQVVVSERRSSGKSSRWVVVYSNTSTAPFDVADITGRMRVYPGRAMELHLRDDVSKSSGLFYSLDEQTQAALNEMGVETKGFLNMNKNMRVQERYIEQGDEIYLLGKTSSKPGARTMMDEEPLIISDQSELRLVSGFSWRVIGNVVLFAIIGLMLAFYFTSR
jgi:hypothetical protein